VLKKLQITGIPTHIVLANANKIFNIMNELIVGKVVGRWVKVDSKDISLNRKMDVGSVV